MNVILTSADNYAITSKSLAVFSTGEYTVLEGSVYVIVAKSYLDMPSALYVPRLAVQIAELIKSLGEGSYVSVDYLNTGQVHKRKYSKCTDALCEYLNQKGVMAVRSTLIH